MERTAHPRVVATDFDGTLLRSDLTLSERTRAALRAAEAAGIEVVVVTARPPRWMDAYADAVGAHGTVLCGNGAFVYDIGRRRVVQTRPIPPDVVTRVAASLRTAVPGIALAAETPVGMVREEGFARDPHVTGVAAATHAVVARVEDCTVPVGKLLARRPDHTGFLAACTAAVPDDVHLAYSGAVGLAEMTARGVTKAAALHRFCADRGIDAQDVWAFGDMPNDVPMLAWAGRSFAVANGHPDAVAAATDRCASNDEDGVAAVIEQVLEQAGQDVARAAVPVEEDR